MYFKTTYPSPFGSLTLASDGVSLVGLWVEGQRYFGASVPGELAEGDGLPALATAKAWLEKYFAGERPSPSELALAPIGGEFRRGVWKLLLDIPYGEVVTYKALAGRMAAKIGRTSMSAQAIGGAVGHNPISIIIPCHRVVGSDGSLTGYAGGLAMKRGLLELEGAK
jgi:methylated-DNA-[protein]-cysteine S-methyltransferase